ncbi:MAG TPA: GNAT family N-acetyltransferase [Hydrogenophaga sp.]|uniref:GNAT family N-acetyltransferase n=1 Tax=Hydrogenophaga sp. TaxID=1904254 RepID=UPI002BCA592D|nr:GNAT family N-acetyltransferase [Hydrogenophaga sp.]HMN92358.1 GNAT family N-acetyltransferase [Hydrogenophaga sp.]HMP10584.1 GNAT family N-acetyltransferase [Hydrogenophaga sp.]
MTKDYVTRVHASPDSIAATDWDRLVALDPDPSPFIGHAYLKALHDSGAATEATGWIPRFISLHEGDRLVGACPLYVKSHSYGEYVFDWSWAQAHEQHGLAYYPKGLVAIPFTPVPGVRLLAESRTVRLLLLKALEQVARTWGLSSLHLLFARPQELEAARELGWMWRETVQFHWAQNAGEDLSSGCFTDFEHFLSSLQQEKRKKIRQERRKVAGAGVVFRQVAGRDITQDDWAFFWRCYERTYLEHGNPPYLNPDFFRQVSDRMPAHWLMFIAEREGRPLACSLIALDPLRRIAYGRYWGALERVDCLHFEACYYQPLQWCIANGYRRFEGGAQGEHKMARALLPVRAMSAHWLAHPAFAGAVDRFLERERQGIAHYLDHLKERDPRRHPAP